MKQMSGIIRRIAEKLLFLVKLYGLTQNVVFKDVCVSVDAACETYWQGRVCVTTRKHFYNKSAVSGSLESGVGEHSDSQEQRGDSTTNVGDNGQDLLIRCVHRSPGHILETNTHTLVNSVSLQQ